LNDIALLKLKNKVELNDYIQIACLPPSKSLYYPGFNISAWIVGWGTVSFGGITSNQLKNAEITIYNDRYCENVLPEFIKNWYSQICAGELEGGVDTCQGDSGGSLYVKDFLNGKERLVSAGIVSYGVI
jgi:hypothetical protein